MIAVSPLVSLMIDSQNVHGVAAASFASLISGGAKGGVGIVVVYGVFY